MVIGSALAIAWVAVNAAATGQEIDRAAQCYANFVNVAVPANDARGAERDRFRLAQLKALVTFLKFNGRVYSTHAVSNDKLHGFFTNILETDRHIFQCLESLKFPLGLIKSYRIQSEFVSALRQGVLATDGQSNPHHTRLLKMLDEHQEYLDAAYERAAATRDAFGF